MPEPRVVNAPDSMFRVAKDGDPLRFSRMNPEDALLERAGNRFDIPGAGVLYAASNPEACFGETLARLRPSQRMRKVLGSEPENGFMHVGGIPQDWRLRRVIAELEVDAGARFIDADDAASLAYLSSELSVVFTAFGITEPLDLGDLRSRNRRLTRAISAAAYNATNDSGDFLYDGIRYGSRLHSDWTCWAIFEGTAISVRSRWAIDKDHPALRSVAEMWDLTVH